MRRRSGVRSVIVEAEVRPTESEERVERALRTIIIPEEIQLVTVGGKRLMVARARSAAALSPLYWALRAEKILDSARAAMKGGVRGSSMEVLFHKQAAYAGKVSLVTDYRESPLGPIRLVVEAEDIGALIDCLAPQTARGRPLWDYRLEECG